MTEEYNKSQILLQKRRAVQELNTRLTQYNRDLVSIVISQEILNAKVKIHDELGAGLLALKNYLVNGGDAATKAKIVQKLKDNVKFLKTETAENKQDEYILIFTTANALDVRITVEGTLIEDEPYKHIIATALHECITNTLRHAKGDMLNIKVVDDGAENTIKVIEGRKIVDYTYIVLYFVSFWVGISICKKQEMPRKSLMIMPWIPLGAAWILQRLLSIVESILIDYDVCVYCSIVLGFIIEIGAVIAMFHILGIRKISPLIYLLFIPVVLIYTWAMIKMSDAVSMLISALRGETGSVFELFPYYDVSKFYGRIMNIVTIGYILILDIGYALRNQKGTAADSAEN